jgi:hypothetical protein
MPKTKLSEVEQELNELRIKRKEIIKSLTLLEDRMVELKIKQDNLKSEIMTIAYRSGKI